MYQKQRDRQKRLTSHVCPFKEDIFEAIQSQMTLTPWLSLCVALLSDANSFQFLKRNDKHKEEKHKKKKKKKEKKNIISIKFYLFSFFSSFLLLFLFYFFHKFSFLLIFYVCRVQCVSMDSSITTGQDILNCPSIDSSPYPIPICFLFFHFFFYIWLLVENTNINKANVRKK